MTTSFFKKELNPWTLKWIFQRVIVVLFIDRRLPQFEFVKKTQQKNTSTKNKELKTNLFDNKNYSAINEHNNIHPNRIDINIYFDNIYLMNLPNQKEKKHKVLNQLNKYKINIQLWNATNGYSEKNIREFNEYSSKQVGNLICSQYNELEKYRGSKFISSPGAWGYNKTMKSILEDAKKNEYKKILIIEDDIILDKDFHHKFNTFINSIDKDWKTIQLGASQYGWDEIENLDHAKTKGFYHSNEITTCGSFALGLTHYTYDDILENISFMESPFDFLIMGSIYKKYKSKCFTCYPNIIIPDVSTSTIREGRDQLQHSKKMKWEIQNFDYPLTSPSFVITTLNNNKTISLKSNSPELSNIKYPDQKANNTDGINEDFLIVLKESISQKELDFIIESTICKDIEFQNNIHTLFSIQNSSKAINKCSEIILNKNPKENLINQINNKNSRILTHKKQNLKRNINNLSTKNKPILSIVIPVYKVENYIEKCLKSVIKSIKFSNLDEYIEIILVDDKCPVNSLNAVSSLIKEYQHSIRIINHKQNLGLGGARNTGIKKANGEYIFFLDSDDWINQYSIYEIFNSIVQEKLPDLIVFGFCAVKTNETIWDYLPTKSNFKSPFKSLYHTSIGDITPAAWNKIFRKQILGQLLFSEHKYYEDLEFTPQLIQKSKTISFNESYLVNYRLDGSSITRQETKSKHILDLDYVLIKLMKNIANTGIASNFFLNRWTYLLKVWSLNKDLSNLVFKQILSFVQNYSLQDFQYSLYKPFLTQLGKLAEAFPDKSKDLLLYKITKSISSKLPLVTVVITTYKRANGVKNAIHSILDQTYPNIEIIVVDDNNSNSSDREETQKVMKKYNDDERINYIKHKCNKNGAAARNSGIFASKGEYICFLDDDDAYLNTKIEKSIIAFEKYDNSYGAVYCGYLGWNSKSNDLSRYKEGDLTLDILLLEYTNHYLSTPTAFYKKAALLKINGFDETFTRHQDLELNLRFLEHYKFGVVPEALVVLNDIITNTNNKLSATDYLDLKIKFFKKFKYKINTYSEEIQNKIYERNWSEVLRISDGKTDFINYLKTRNDIAPISLLIDYYENKLEKNSEIQHQM